MANRAEVAELKKLVIRKLSNHSTDAEVREELVKDGWSRAEVDRVFTELKADLELVINKIEEIEQCNEL